MIYTVGEMAKKLGVAASTLRYYDKEGLLPLVERSSSGIRMFRDEDYEWLLVISCLKKTGMSLKNIKEFIYLVMEGDSTIDKRLSLFIKQKEAMEKRMAELQETLDMLDFKCWYYRVAKEAGTTDILRDMPIEDIPEEYREIKYKLQNVDLQNDK